MNVNETNKGNQEIENKDKGKKSSLRKRGRLRIGKTGQAKQNAKPTFQEKEKRLKEKEKYLGAKFRKRRDKAKSITRTKQLLSEIKQSLSKLIGSIKESDKEIDEILSKRNDRTQLLNILKEMESK